MIRIILCFVLVSILSSCSSTQKASNEFTTLATQLEGYFISSKQSLKNDFYENRSLRITPIWKEKGTYFLVEQALIDNPNHPFSVEVYKLVQKHNGISKEVYTIKNVREWQENWQTKDAYSTLIESDIEPKPGCAILLQRSLDSNFFGHTGINCVEAANPKTHYSSSGIVLNSNSIRMWSQGHDKDWKPVYGSVKGGYIYERVVAEHSN